MNRTLAISLFFFAALSSVAVGVVACDTETASSAVVDNAYPPTPADPATQIVVYRAWWVATYFSEPVAGGAASAEVRSVPATDTAYAVLAPRWDPASTTPPRRFIPIKSKALLSVARGEVLHIAVSDETFTGNCLAGQPLSQEDADFITQRIFPGEFANVTYDAKTCTTTPTPSADGGPVPIDDAATDAATDGARDAEGGTDAGPG